MRDAQTSPARAGSLRQGVLSLCFLTRALVGLSLSILWVTGGCWLGETPEGFLGDERLVYFQPSNEQVFSQRLMTGSRFWLNVQARREDDDARVLVARLRPSDDAVVRVHLAEENGADFTDAGPLPLGGAAGAEDDALALESNAEDAGPEVAPRTAPVLPSGTAKRYWIEILAPGDAQLILEDDQGGIDQIALQAADAEQIDLLDLGILGNDLDARLPNRFGMLNEARQELAVAAEDRCGGPLLALDAIDLTSSDATICQIQRDNALAFALSTQAEGQVEMNVVPYVPKAILGEPVPFSLAVYAADDVDDLRLEVAAVEGNTALVWGRAFASDTEVIGLEYAWDATERIDLDRVRGPWVNASLYIPQEDEAPDDRPAEVFASWENNDAEIDLLTVRENEVNRTRLPPPTPESVNTSASCAGDPCDPLGASMFGAWIGWRRIRRYRKRLTLN